MSIQSRQRAFPTEESLKMATEAAAIGIWDLALPSNELQWSNRCNEIFGLPLDAELRYEDFLERVHPEDRNRVNSVVQAVMDPQGTGDYDIEYRIVRPDHDIRWVAAKGKVGFTEVDGRRVPYQFMGTLLDRTEQKQTHQALIESEKLAVTSRLAACIAHEIRNPLDSVGNLLCLLRDETCEEDRAHYVSLAQQELTRAAEIAAHTLQFYRDPIGTALPYDLADFTETVLAVFAARLRECQIRLSAKLQAGFAVQVSQGELRQVLVNLIGNALDALRPRGDLCIRLRRVRGQNGEEKAMLTIADTGNGMTAEVKARIFEAFFTTKQEQGNGIGLWLTAEILQKYGASIRVKSAKGKGTVFSLFFPHTLGDLS